MFPLQLSFFFFSNDSSSCLVLCVVAARRAVTPEKPISSSDYTDERAGPVVKVLTVHPTFQTPITDLINDFQLSPFLNTDNIVVTPSLRILARNLMYGFSLDQLL